MKTIFDLLSFSFDSLPNAACVEVGKKSNEAGDEITEYVSALDKPELGLFKMMKVMQFKSGGKNVGLSNPNHASIKVAAVEKLVNTLFAMYGGDDLNPPGGAFTADDQQAIEEIIEDPSGGFWNGRMWTKLPNHGVMLNFDDEGLTLFIHGPAKQS